MKPDKKVNEFLCDFIPILILAACSIGLFIRSFYSFSWSDESFYLTLAHRFWLGERMIADEWNPAQLSTLLLLPFTYFKLKKRNSRMASLICALIYFLYFRVNIGGMTYYNVILNCTLLASELLYFWARDIICGACDTCF